MKNLQNIIDIASDLIVSGKATEDNAIEMAIEIDNERIINVMQDVQSIRRGYKNDRNINQKGFQIVMNRVYRKLQGATK